MSEFGKLSTADDVLAGIDLSGTRVLITGANSGLGKESARAMAAHGADVVMLGRDQVKLDSAKAEIEAAHPDSALETLVCDLASLDSIAAAGEQARKRFDRIDLLINNAAVMAYPKSATADGFEMQFGTNHLGHFALTGELMPLVLKGADSSGGGRIVNLSSRGHFMSDIDLDDPNFEHRDYNEWVSYGQAKTANALFSVGLEKRFADHGVHAYAVHPGGIQTNLGRHLSEDQAMALVERVTSAEPDFAWKTEAQGAATQVWAATAEELEGQGGVYCEDCHVAQIDDASMVSGVRSYALDPARAERLWTISEEMTGAPFAA
ncbi:MAG: SDR family NAD(P)-dependent oxidoreductase [Pseudomonadota bacterium]